MASWTELVATVVVHSSTAALSHFGVTVEPAAITQALPANLTAERVVARSPKSAEPLADCPKPRPRAPSVHA